MLVKCIEIKYDYMVNGIDLISTNFVVGGIYEWKNGRIHGDTGKLLVGMAKGGVIRNWRLSYYVTFELFNPRFNRLYIRDLIHMDGQTVWTSENKSGDITSCFRKVDIKSKNLYRIDNNGKVTASHIDFDSVDSPTADIICYSGKPD